MKKIENERKILGPGHGFSLISRKPDPRKPLQIGVLIMDTDVFLQHL